MRSVIMTALRNMIRNRSFSLINLIGLSVAMSLGMLVMMVVRDQLSFDNFHAQASRIYRINTRALRVDGGSEPYASAPLALGKAVSEEYTFASDVVRLYRSFQGDAVYGQVNVPLSGFLADPSFFRVFDFEFEEGDPMTALQDPTGLVLSAAAAKKVFGEQNPLGRVLTVGGFGDFTVTGVLKPLAGNTHLDFEMIGSMTALPSWEKTGVSRSTSEQWTDYYSAHVYFVLKDGLQERDVQSALDQLAKKNIQTAQLETRDKGIEFYLQPLTAITPGPILSNTMGRGVPEVLLVLMGVLATIVLVMACFNYTNLMIAKSLTRAREIGIRKVMGAHRRQVFAQFIGEAVVFALAALISSYVILQGLKVAFLRLHLVSEYSVHLQEDVTMFGWFLAFALGVGMLAGALPAGYLSSFRPIRVLKDAAGQRVYSRLALRKVLVVAQFTLSIVFTVVVLVIYNQVQYMVNKDYGIQEKDLLNVRLQGNNFDRVAVSVSQIPGVLSIGGVSHRLGTWSDRASDYRRTELGEPFVMRDFAVDHTYVDHLQVEFKAGHNFSPAEEGPRESHVILNEAALAQFGFQDASSAIGQVIYVDDSVMLSVIGVTKNFHFRPLSYAIGPLALRYKKDDLAFMNVQVQSSRGEEVKAKLAQVWKQLDPVHPLEATWMEEEIDEAYERAGFGDVLWVVGYVSVLAIVLACLGMLGMAMYATTVRLKEIGIRKVMGAEPWQVVATLSQSFLWLILIALAIGLPLGYFLGESYLESYAFRIPISVGLLSLGTAIILGLGLVTIISQTWKATTLNPVETLRHE